MAFGWKSKHTELRIVRHVYPGGNYLQLRQVSFEDDKPVYDQSVRDLFQYGSVDSYKANARAILEACEKPVIREQAGYMEEL